MRHKLLIWLSNWVARLDDWLMSKRPDVDYTKFSVRLDKDTDEPLRFEGDDVD